MVKLPLDFKEFLSLLHTHHVRYLLVALTRQVPPAQGLSSPCYAARRAARAAMTEIVLRW